MFDRANPVRRLLPVMILAAVTALSVGLAFPIGLTRTVAPSTNGSNAASPSSELPDLHTLPLHFEPNRGQTDHAVRFLTRAAGTTLFFTLSEVVLALQAGAGPVADARNAESESQVREPRTDNVAQDSKQSVVRVQFVGATANSVESGAPLPGRVNYLIGDDTSKWLSGLPTFSDITYSALYPGIDLSYSGGSGQLKGTYTVAAGADPSLIRWRYEGADHVSLQQDGSLLIVVSPASDTQ